MAIRDGNTVIRPSAGGRVRWRPIEPVADEYDAAKSLGWSILGVIGNASHLRGSGGHTPWCSEGGAKLGWVYAIDIGVPAAQAKAFEQWLLGRLRAGYYPWVYYWNCNNRHWARRATKTSGGKTVPFAYSVYSGDHHLHLSGRGGYEQANSSILRDFANRNTTPAKPPAKPATEEDELDAAEKERLINIERMLGALRDRSDTVTLVANGKPVEKPMGAVADLGGISWALGIRPGQTPEQVRDAQEASAIAALDARLARIEAALARLIPPTA